MERYIGLDVHAASCTLAVISQTGRRLRDFPVEINGQALVEAVRMIPSEKHLVFERGLQSAWHYETLCPHVAEIVVAGVTESRGPGRKGLGVVAPVRIGQAFENSPARRRVSGAYGSNTGAGGATT